MFTGGPKVYRHGDVPVYHVVDFGVKPVNSGVEGKKNLRVSKVSTLGYTQKN